MPCGRSQNGTDESLAKEVALLVHKEEEERLVPDDRPSQPNPKLVAVFVILLDTVEVVEPVACIERRVAVGPKCATAELIGSRARHHLHLPGAAPGLGIDVCGNDANFLDQVGTGKCGRKCSEIIASV